MRARPDATGWVAVLLGNWRDILPRAPAWGSTCRVTSQCNARLSAAPSPTKCQPHAPRLVPTAERSAFRRKACRLEEGEHAHLDALARRCIGRRRRILERGMDGEPRAAVGRGVE